MTVLDGTQNRGKLDTDAPHHFRCSLCDARCTRGPSGTEYGHRSGCSNRPDEFSGGDSYVDAGNDDQTVVTDGGTFDCEGCGDETPVSDRRRYMHRDQPDVGPVQFDELCPTCSTRKPSERLFRGADDQRGDSR